MLEVCSCTESLSVWEPDTAARTFLNATAVAYLHTPHSLVDGPDLLRVKPTRDVHHADSATDELQHRLSLKEGCCSDVSVESQS